MLSSTSHSSKKCKSKNMRHYVHMGLRSSRGCPPCTLCLFESESRSKARWVQSGDRADQVGPKASLSPSTIFVNPPTDQSSCFSQSCLNRNLRRPVRLASGIGPLSQPVLPPTPTLREPRPGRTRGRYVAYVSSCGAFTCSDLCLTLSGGRR